MQLHELHDAPDPRCPEEPFQALGRLHHHRPSRCGEELLGPGRQRLDQPRPIHQHPAGRTSGEREAARARAPGAARDLASQRLIPKGCATPGRRVGVLPTCTPFQGGAIRRKGDTLKELGLQFWGGEKAHRGVAHRAGRD